ncbi:MAG: peptidylprolyl isomerase [Planctomycetes bacterium]|nr:peptidylprolyl isomerase [Planctomycetota bacterium]
MPYNEIEEKPDGLKETYKKIQPYQNIIFFVLLIIFLVVLLVVWRNYRINKMNDAAWSEIGKVPFTSANLKVLIDRYKLTEIVPLLEFRLGNALAQEGNYKEASDIYKSFINKYPEHPFVQKAKENLAEAEKNMLWTGDAGRLTEEKKKLLVKRDMPHLTIQTAKGNFEVELFEDDAPNTVANFIALVQENFYNQVPFFELRGDLGICIGAKVVTQTFTVPFEKNTLKHEAGSLGMLRAVDPEAKEGVPEREKYTDSATTRFYICLNPNADSDGKYTVFGRVLKGMEVVNQLSPGVQITGITINHKRSHAYEPKRITRDPAEIPTPAPPIPPTPPVPPIPPPEIQVPPVPPAETPVTPTPPVEENK